MTLAALLSVPLAEIGGREWILILLAILVLFGGSKLPALGKGIGEGIRNFKKGLKGEDDADKAPPTKEIDKK